MRTPELVRMTTESSHEIPRELIQDIMLRLPAKDVIRSRGVSRLWRDSLRDPSFLNLHGKANHELHAAAETLLVSEKREHGCSDEVGVFSVSSGKALCRVPIMSGYVLANVCNGFLCFMHDSRSTGPEAPAMVCNPATGETAKLPEAPPLDSWKKMHLFALGFSPATNEYKLFRLSSHKSLRTVYVDVYTLGGTGSAGGWRTKLYFSDECRPVGKGWAPVLIDGKLYMPNLPWTNRYTEPSFAPERILVIDVSTERCHSYRLPNYWTYPYEDTILTNAFELSGQLCFVVHIIDNHGSQSIRFWVMSPPPPEEEDDYYCDNNGELCHSMCYNFHMEGYYSPGLPCAGWLGDKGMLWYMQGFTLRKYDTRGLTPNYETLQWDQQVELQTTPLLPGCRWPNIYGGYRPTLLSPLTLQPQDDVNDENRYQLEHVMLRTLSDATKH